MKKWRFATLFLAGMLLGANAGEVPSPQVWLAPFWRANDDFVDMFRPDALGEAPHLTCKSSNSIQVSLCALRINKTQP